VAAGLEGGPGVLVVETGRARDHADVHAGSQDVPVVLGGGPEAEVGLDALQELGALAGHRHELDVLVAQQVRQVGGHRPAAGADDTHSDA
jgi:hypothetical protein